LDGEPQELRSGKGIRPLLTLLSCAALRGRMEPAVAIAAAIELTHEFSLIHDDIEDGDRERRGRATLWSEVGEAQAINAGDALFVVAREQIATTLAMGLDAEVVLALYRRYDDACLQLAEGQYLDIDFERRASVSLAAYRAMVLGKTGALIGAAAAMGAVAAGAGENEAAAFEAYGKGLGIGFQMHDDVLGIWGDPARTGKPAGNDLRQRKRSLPILLALTDEELGQDLDALLRDPAPIDDDAVAEWTQLLEAAGIRDQAERAAMEEVDRARASIDALDLEAIPHRLLDQLLRLSVERDR
jgi:geranylgeranyl diphosphate synthase type I